MKNEEKSIICKLALSEWTDCATENSLQQFSRSTRIFTQFVYIFVFLASASYCVFSIGLTIKKYYQYETITSLKIVNEMPTDFPAITFCNLKRLNKTSAKKFIEKSLFHEDNSSVIDFNETNLFGYYYDILDNLMLNLAELNESEQVRRSFGFKLGDMVLNCRFNLIECEKQDFQYFFQSQYGNCYTYNNGNKTKQSILAGPKFGLELDIFVGDPIEHSKFEMDDGIIIVVHNQSNLPFLNNDRILAATGSETDLKINRNFITKLGPPYTECMKNEKLFKSEFHDYIVNKLKIKYTQQHCYSLCLQKEVFKKCKCSSNWLLNFKDKKYCNSTQIECILDNVGYGLSGEIPNNCVEECPLECEIIEYNVATSRISYPSPYLRNLLAKHSLIKSSGIENEMIDKTVLKVNIYYETLAFKTVTETESMTAQIFFANVGGTFSLCLGFSILSLVKLVGFLVSIIILFKEKKFEMRRISQKESDSVITASSSSSRKKQRPRRLVFKQK